MPAHAKNVPTSLDATVTSKGQVTLPRELQLHLGLSQGSRIRFTIPASGTAKVEPVLYELEDLWRMVDQGTPCGSAMTFEEMDAAKSLGKW